MPLIKMQQAQLSGTLASDVRDNVTRNELLKASRTLIDDLNSLRTQIKTIQGTDTWTTELSGSQDLAKIHTAMVIDQGGLIASFKDDVYVLGSMGITGSLDVKNIVTSVGGFSGSLTQLANNGGDYLRCGKNISTVTGALGEITITANPGAVENGVQYNVNGYFTANNKFTFAMGEDEGENPMGKLYLTGSVAEGFETNAVGDYSHSEGFRTIAYGMHSHAEGNQTTTSVYGILSAYIEGDIESSNYGKLIVPGDFSSVIALFTKARLTNDNFKDLIKYFTFTVDSNDINVSGGDTIAGISLGGGATTNFLIGKSFDLVLENATLAAVQSAISAGVTLHPQFTGENSHAEGSFTRAMGNGSHAEGGTTQALGEHSHAEGTSTQAWGENSHAEGFETTAFSFTSHSEGNQTTAYGPGARSSGNQTVAYGNYSTTHGTLTTAGFNGWYGTIDQDGKFSVGQNLVDFYQNNFDERGQQRTPPFRLYHVDTNEFVTSGFSQIELVGGETKFTIYETFPEGTPFYLIAADPGGYNKFGVAPGAGTDWQLFSGRWSTAQGAWTSSPGVASHAEGYQATAWGEYSHAEGYGTNTIAASSHAEGNQTNTFAEYSHAEGYRTATFAVRAHAEGHTTSAGGGIGFESCRLETNINGLNNGITDGIAHLYIGGNLESYGLNNILITYSSGQYNIIVNPGSGTYNPSTNETQYIINIGNFGISKTYANSGLGTVYVDVFITGNSGAFQAGRTIISNGGYHSHTEGEETYTLGDGSHAEGYRTLTVGQNSHAEGHTTVSVGNGSHAEGYKAKAGIGIYHGQYSHAEGYETSTTADFSHSEGLRAQAKNIASHAEGSGSISFGVASHAEGKETFAGSLVFSAILNGDNKLEISDLNTCYGDDLTSYFSPGKIFYASYHFASDNPNSTAYDTRGLLEFEVASSEVSGPTLLITPVSVPTPPVGETFATFLIIPHDLIFNAIPGSLEEEIFRHFPGISSHSEGYKTRAIRGYSHAEGKETITLGLSSHAEGYQTLTLGESSHAEGYLTTGSALYSHAEGMDTLADGIGSHAEGKLTWTFGDGAHAEGILTAAGGLYAHSEGSGSLAMGIAAHAEGQLTSAPASYSHAEGWAVITSGSWSHAEGKATITSGSWSHAEGIFTIARGIGSHAEGSGSLSVGIGSHAEGKDTTALGNYSHAGGRATIASGYGANAIGLGSVAAGDFSFAAGHYVVASSSYQAVFGRWNKENNSDSLFIIGGGTDDEDRRDLMLVGQNTIMMGSGSLSADTFFFVSGSIGSKAAGILGTALFGGDTYVSGVLYAENGISGSLTKLANGEDYLVAGIGITLMTGANGSITISANSSSTKKDYFQGDSGFLSNNIFTFGVGGANMGTLSTPTDEFIDVYLNGVYMSYGSNRDIIEIGSNTFKFNQNLGTTLTSDDIISVVLRNVQ